MFSLWPAAEVIGGDPSEAVFSWLVRLRWLAVLGVASILVLAGPVLHRLPADSIPWLWSVAGALGAYNAALTTFGPRGPPWLTAFGVQIAIDCVALASLVHFAGGVENPFLPLFVLHVVNANIVLSGGAALRVLGLAIALVTAVVLAEGSGLVAHHCLRRGAEPCASGAVDLRALAVLGGLVVTFLASSLFTRFLTAKLRRGQRKLIATVNELNHEKDRLADARAEMATEHGRLQAIIDCMGDAVTFVGSSGDVLFSNQRAREIWRAGSPAIASRSFESLFEAEIRREQPPSGAQLTFERAGRTFEANYSLVRSAQGEALGMVMVARDITERLAMEKHLMHDEQMSVVGKLAATVAHEVNNPIGVIFLYSQHALAKLLPDHPVYEHLKTIRRNADSCRKIVGGLLNLARPHKPERHLIDLRQLCREVVDSAQPLAVSSGTQISNGTHDFRVPIWANVDAGMLRQAVLNLAVNAIDAVGPGGEVSVFAYETQDGKETAHAIEVRDTGAGMAAEQLTQIFQPFFTTKANGTGLGLSVAANVIKSHDGRIEVESAVGAGTTFRIVLPDHTNRDASSHALQRDHVVVWGNL